MNAGIAPSIVTLLLRELRAVRRQVEAYPDDASPWRTLEGLPNSGGTLVLHVAGNLQHFIGAVLGGTGYRRNRDAEFTARDLSRQSLVAEVDAAMACIQRTAPLLTDDLLESAYPEQIVGRTLPTATFLLHLCAHLAYHLGQLDAHRRIVTGNAAGVGAVAASEL